MRKVIAIVLFILLFIPTIVSAHTGLSSSNPTEGQVVTSGLQEITLIYEGEIEKLSTMKLVKDGLEIPIGDVQVDGQRMVGKLPSPLENGAYTVQWSIAGEDGHPIKGDIHFNVELAKTSNEAVPEIEPKKEEEKTVRNGIIEDTKNKEVATEVNESESDSSIISVRTLLVSGAVLLIGIVFLLFLRRKR